MVNLRVNGVERTLDSDPNMPPVRIRLRSALTGGPFHDSQCRSIMPGSFHVDWGRKNPCESGSRFQQERVSRHDRRIPLMAGRPSGCRRARSLRTEFHIERWATPVKRFQ